MATNKPAIKLTIEINDETLERVYQPSKIKLKTKRAIQEAQETGKWADLISVVATMLDLTVEQTEELTQEQFDEIFEAIKDATTVPNESAPPSEQP